MQTISSAVRWWAHVAPQRLALAIGDRSLTYRELWERSLAVAAWLDRRGVSGGDRVAICAANSVDYWVVVLGVLRVGAMAAPLHARSTAVELTERVASYRPALIVTDAEQADKFDTATVRLQSLALAADAPFDGPDVPEPHVAAMIIMTSGSTGTPKGVLLSHASVTDYAAAWAIREPGFAHGARIIGAGLASTAAGFVKVMQYLVAGASFRFEAEFDAERFLALMVAERITTFSGVPVFLQRIAECSGFATADLSALTTVATAGAPVPRAVQDRWAEKGIVVRQGYGQTECGGVVTLMPAQGACRFPEKCGSGNLFTELMTVDSVGQPCPSGEPGEILVRGSPAMLGYWNDDAATAAVRRDGWIATGDVGVLDEAGNLTFVARLRDIIISGGLNISCAEVEQVIEAFDGVREVAVIGVTDERFGETPLAVVHVERGFAVDALIRHCNTRLADYKVPRYVVVEDEPLPRLPIGKLAKHQLRERYGDAHRHLPRVR